MAKYSTDDLGSNPVTLFVSFNCPRCSLPLIFCTINFRSHFDCKLWWMSKMYIKWLKSGWDKNSFPNCKKQKRGRKCQKFHPVDVPKFQMTSSECFIRNILDYLSLLFNDIFYKMIFKYDPPARNHHTNQCIVWWQTTIYIYIIIQC